MTDNIFQKFFNEDMIKDIMNVNLNKDIEKCLFDYQCLHVINLIASLSTNNIIIDGSDTGTGKTFCSIAVAKQLNLKPFIICPKSVINCWYEVCEKFNCESYGIVNYETIKNLMMYEDKKNINRIPCKYLTKNKNTYLWNLPKDAILIFDEVHKCTNKKTQNGQLLLASKNVKKSILLSATLADSNKSFLIYGYLLNFYKKLNQGRSWLNSFIKSNKSFNSMIYPKYGSRLIISDLKEKFPQNHITSNSYNLDPVIEQDIDTYFKYIDDKLKLINDKKLDKNEQNRTLAKITKVRIKIEKLKIDIFVELAKQYLKEGKSVIIFVNFLKTLHKLAEIFDSTCLIYGDQTNSERQINIKEFQTNQKKLIICIMKSGSQSINLHDTDGNHPRVSLISPSFSSIDLKQALGRAYRANTKSPVLQHIIFSANNCEKSISKSLQDKLSYQSNINDQL